MTETHRTNEQPLLSDPKILLVDNESAVARQMIADYYRAKDNGTLTHIEGCSDARANAGAFLHDPTIEFNPSIAAAGDKEFIRHIVLHPGVQQIIVLQHFDGSTVAPGKYPKGCGGLGVKEERVKNNERTSEGGILEFVDRRIHHPGIYNQSIASAVEVAKYTKKIVLAGALDHITGFIHPFAIVSNQGKTIDASVPANKFNDPFYIYREGIPDLPETEIPESFMRILVSNKARVAELARVHPDIDKTQKVQDPPAIILTTSLLPTTTRYPHIFGDPNTNFGISIPYVKHDGQVTGLHEQGFEEVLAQLEYPIGNATQSQSGHGGHGFHRTHRLIIETPDINLSESIGRTITDEPWMQQWLNIPQNQIWVFQVVSGHSIAAEILR